MILLSWRIIGASAANMSLLKHSVSKSWRTWIQNACRTIPSDQLWFRYYYVAARTTTLQPQSVEHFGSADCSSSWLNDDGLRVSLTLGPLGLVPMSYRITAKLSLCDLLGVSHSTRFYPARLRRAGIITDWRTSVRLQSRTISADVCTMPRCPVCRLRYSEF